MKKIIGKMGFDKEAMMVIDKARTTLGIQRETMLENIKKICEIAIEQRNDLQFTLETFFNLVQKYYPEYDTSEKVKKVL